MSTVGGVGRINFNGFVWILAEAQEKTHGEDLETTF
jgi:hypothetical protein